MEEKLGRREEEKMVEAFHFSLHDIHVLAPRGLELAA
jgi:hypothetical protein